MTTVPTGRWRWLLTRLREDRGSATGWAIGMMIMTVLLAGLIVDGARAMTAKIDATDVAQQAARAGADQLDLLALRTRGIRQLDPDNAQHTAEAWLARASAHGFAEATTTTVQVTVTRTDPTVLLRVIGIDTVTVTAQAHAEPVTH